MLKGKFANVAKKLIYAGMQKIQKGNLYSFYEGDENYTKELVCVGCYQYESSSVQKNKRYKNQ